MVTHLPPESIDIFWLSGDIDTHARTVKIAMSGIRAGDGVVVRMFGTDYVFAAPSFWVIAGVAHDCTLDRNMADDSDLADHCWGIFSEYLSDQPIFDDGVDADKLLSMAKSTTKKKAAEAEGYMEMF